MLELLEYKIGVTINGAELRWHYNNKNSESVLRTGKQRLKRLRAWRSGTYSRKLLEVVKCRLVAMKKMTRFRDKSNWQRGSGNGTADLKCTVIEFFTELVCCLGYPMKSLRQCVKLMARNSSVWAEVYECVVQIDREFKSADKKRE